MIVAAVPVKDLAHAKQRLLPVLDPVERRALARAMLADVLRALRALPLDAVWVVTREPETAALARALGAEPLAEAENRGHTAAVAAAQTEAARRGARVFLTVPGDVPCLTPGEVQALVAAASPAPCAVLAPSRSGLGTNGVALAPPAAMRLRFGEPSFDGHVDTARAAGLGPRVLRLPGLALDIDAPEDLAALLADGTDTETRGLVAGWRLADRLAAAGVPAGR
jgi:2-phospho-L-lactate guanylyltransferase